MNKTARALLCAGVLLLLVGGWKLMQPGSRPAAGQSIAKKQAAAPAVKLPEGPVVVDVMMGDDGYVPNIFEIKAGQAVRFTNTTKSGRWPASNLHPTHKLYPEFDPKRALEPGESWTFTFRKKGTWRMHDHLYPYMKGTITVD